MTKRSFAAGGWIVIIPLTAAIAAYVMFVFLPGMNEVRELRADIVSKQAFLSGSAARLARAKAAEEEEAAIRAYLKKWRGTTAKANGAAQVFGDLAECIKASGAETTAFRPETKQTFASFERVPVTIGCVGTFSQLQALLSSVESLPQRIWIDEAVFECDRKDGETMRCEIRPAIFVDNLEILD